MMWTGVRSPAVASRTSCSKKGTSAPGCWKGFSAEPARYSSTLLCAAARAAALTAGAAGRFFFFLAAVFFLAAAADGEPASRQQPKRAAPSARGIRLRIIPDKKRSLAVGAQLAAVRSHRSRDREGAFL